MEVIKLSCGKCNSKCEEKDEKKPAKKGAAKKEKVEGKCVGAIEHYYSKLGVGIVKLKDKLAVGDKVKIKGHTTDIDQTVDSIQINHEDVQDAKKGDIVGIKVSDKVREEDCVYLVK